MSTALPDNASGPERRSAVGREETEARIRAALDALLDSVAVYSAIRDPTGRVLDFRIDEVNEAACRDSGLPRDQQVGKGLCEVLPAHRENGLFDAYCRLVESGEPLVYEALEYEDAEGGGQRVKRALDLRAARLGDGLVAAWRDVTDRKRTEQKLAESLGFLDLLLTHAPVAVALVDRAFRHVRVNAAAAAMSGTTPEQAMGRTLAEVAPDLWPTLEPLYRSVLETGQPLVGIEVSGRAAAGQAEGTYLASYFPVRHPATQAVLGVGLIVNDITERTRVEAERARLLEAERRARAAAEEEQARLRQVLDVLPEAVVIADTTHVVLANRAAVAVSGSELVGRAVPFGSAPAYGSRDFDGRPIPADDLPLQRSLRRGESVVGMQYLQHHAAGDRDVPLLVNSAPLRDAAGAVVGAVAVFQDISAIKDMERQKDEFLAVVSHDLKQPLATVKGRAQLLRRRLARGGTVDPVALADGLAALDRSADELLAQMAELLDVARLQMDLPLELRRAPVDLVALVRQAVADVQATTQAHTIRLATTAQAVRGSLDAVRLRRVLDNVLSNAVKFSPRGGEIVVRVAREDGPGGPLATIAVEDYGLGIPAADLPRLFERFHRGSNVVGRIEGTGLGLAGAHRIVEQHGGHIEVQSQEGVGSTFTIRLPCREAIREG